MPDPAPARRTERGIETLLVTGPSGAGRSTTINALEDIGFEVIDNLPLSLLPTLLDRKTAVPLALVLDVRNRDFSVDALIGAIDRLTTDRGDAGQVLYLDASDDILQRRYSETRRNHPMAPAGPPLAGITAEKRLLGPIRARADLLIDTTTLSPHELRAEIEHHFAPNDGKVLGVSVHSFSYKRGLPRGLDMVLDCRFLRNPHWDPVLRPLDGRDPGVGVYIDADPRAQPFFDRVNSLVELLLPAHKDEGRAHLAIGFGCTGGQHRSVVMAERLAASLAKTGWPVSIRHRELERRAHVDAGANQGP
ncbi:RNase adapter RapZ [Loktanella sp. SALINAS62]|uniref:RNase adapter RapZ n=1 Tax=Loktanella sp. SALINAS62 TaxID=2706124 RepID=UPI001B8C8165|nr:RNase adapter RapZ [Loktanella sp. SALINAS62]MBS1302194.1 RNase adapter RapZ [Loktanella sp. SALINAS62]